MEMHYIHVNARIKNLYILEGQKTSIYRQRLDVVVCILFFFFPKCQQDMVVCIRFNKRV